MQQYTHKEEVLARARNQDQILFNEEEIALYQYLSPITLRNRKALRPLLKILNDNQIQYRWQFLFGLAAAKDGHNALLRVQEDLFSFCDILQLDPPLQPDWYEEFRLPEGGDRSRPLRPLSPRNPSPKRPRRQKTPKWKGQPRYIEDYRSP